MKGSERNIVCARVGCAHLYRNYPISHDRVLVPRSRGIAELMILLLYKF